MHIIVAIGIGAVVLLGVGILLAVFLGSILWVLGSLAFALLYAGAFVYYYFLRPEEPTPARGNHTLDQTREAGKE